MLSSGWSEADRKRHCKANELEENVSMAVSERQRWSRIEGDVVGTQDRAISEHSEPSIGEPLATTEPLASPADRIAAIESLLANQVIGSEQQLATELQTLMSTAKADPTARKLILERMQNAAGTPLSEILVTALTVEHDPEVEAQAVHLARSGSTSQQRLLGVALLSQAQLQNAETRAVLLDLLRSETSGDAPLAIASLGALERRGAVTPNEQAQVLEAVKPYAAHTDPAVREQGLKVLAEWAPQDRSVVQMISSATRDPDPIVRMSAVLSLGHPAFRFDDTREAIVARMQDSQEDMQVRLAAWQVLGSFPLDDQLYAAHAEFKQAHAAETQAIN